MCFYDVYNPLILNYLQSHKTKDFVTAFRKHAGVCRFVYFFLLYGTIMAPTELTIIQPRKTRARAPGNRWMIEPTKYFCSCTVHRALRAEQVCR